MTVSPRGGWYALAIDHGTSGIKAALVSADGAVLDFEFAATPIHYLPGGGAEQDPEDWWNAVLQASKRLLAREGAPPGQIKAVCVSSTFSTTTFVGRDGEVLMPALTWMDSRGAPYVRRVAGGFPSLQGYNLGRMRTWISRTGGGPALSGKDDIAHILFVQHEFPEVYRDTFMFLPSKDYLNLRLTGKFAASYESVQLFWATDTRDANNIRYDDKLIGLLGIDRDKLPPLRAATDVLGPLRAEVADELGLAPDTQVVMGAPDHHCALVGSGAVRDFEGHLYIGTSSWIECVVPFKKTDLFHQIASLPSAIPGKYQVINEQDYAGGALDFLVDNVLGRSGAFRSDEPPDSRYGRVNAMAGASPVGSNGLLFTPWLNGERTPVDDTTIRGGWHNVSKTTALEDMARSVFEGVAFNTRWSLNYVERFAGRKLDPLHAIGGGAQSDLWCQILADVLGRQIRRVHDPRQANARGAAWLAAVGMGQISFDDVPGLIACDRTFDPNPAHRQTYDELYEAFVLLYRRTKGIFAKLNRR